MSFADQWKQAKAKYESAVKEKKPSEKWLGHFRKSTGIESACKDLDSAIKKSNRKDAEKALAALKTAGTNYIGVLDKALEGESKPLKEMKTKNLKFALDELMTEAHNEIKGLDDGQFELVLGPDIMTPVTGLKFPKDPFIKSLATNADFAKAGATNAVDPAVQKAQQDFARALQVGSSAYTIFIANKGKTMKKSMILNIAKQTLDTMFDSVGRDGMLGQCAYWERAQVQAFGPNANGMAQFKKKTPMQVLDKVAHTLNDDAVRLNTAKEKLKGLKV